VWMEFILTPFGLAVATLLMCSPLRKEGSCRCVTLSLFTSGRICHAPAVFTMGWCVSCIVAAAGNLAGLALAPVLLHTVGWRGLFYVFGLLGVPLLALWLKVETPPPPCWPCGSR